MNAVPLLILSAFSCGATPQGIVLDFSASWCGPCQQMNPIVSRLEREGLPIRKVDVDRERELAQQYGISSIPAFVLVINGKPLTRLVGARSEAELRQLISRIPMSEPARHPAQQVATRGQPPVANPVRANPVRPAPPANPVIAKTETQPEGRYAIPFISQAKAKPRGIANRDRVVRGNLDDQPETTCEIPCLDPMEASTRIRITDKSGINFGSGTIVESRPGRTLILTCGHIFRDFKKESLVEVDVFHNGRSQTFVGKPVRYDLEADIGLISIPTDSVLPRARIAPTGYQVRVSAGVQSIGCGGGEKPTRQQLRVTAINRYRGPENIECTGVPIQGRSGGGLFDAEGQVIGVCTAADPRDRRGLYAGLKAIHELLQECQLAHLFQESSAQESSEDEFLADDSADEAADPRDAPVYQATKTRQSRETATADLDRVNSEVESLQVVRDAFRDAGDAEVICVIRPLKNSQAASRVVVLNRASAQFVNSLNSEVQAQSERKQTSLKVIRKPVVVSQRGNHLPPLISDTKLGAEELEATVPPRRYRRTKSQPE